MLEEQKELYFFTKDHFKENLKRIRPTCVAPLIAVRQVVKKAIYKYIADYCSKDVDPYDVFTEEDFQEVSKKICDEIMEGGN